MGDSSMMRSLPLVFFASLACAAAIAKEPLTSQSSPDNLVPEASSPETELVAELEVAEHVVPGASIMVPPGNASTGRTFSHSKAAIQTGRGSAVQRLTKTIYTPASEGDWHKLLTSTHKSLTAEAKIKLVWQKQKAEKEISKKKKAAELAVKKRVAAMAAAKKKAAAKKAAQKEHHAKLKEKGIKSMNQVLEGSTKSEVQRKASRKASKKRKEKRDKTYTAESKKKREAAYKAGVEAAKKAAKKHTAAHETRKAELKRKALIADKELQEKVQEEKGKVSKHKKVEAHQNKKEHTAKKAEAEGHTKHKAAAELKKKTKEHAGKAAEKKLSQHHHHPGKQSDEVLYKIGRKYFLQDKKKKMKHAGGSAKQVAATEKKWHAQTKHIWQLKLKNKIATEEGMAQAGAQE